MCARNWIAVFVVTSSYLFSFKLNCHPITRSETQKNGFVCVCVCVCVCVWGGGVFFFCWKIKFMLLFRKSEKLKGVFALISTTRKKNSEAVKEKSE